MPVFHTKTIQSILDPVAQQLSQLVIMTEDTEVERAISGPVETVHAAVANLIKVAKATIDSSKDEVVKRDMPPTVETVERATGLLKEAAAGFDIDPKCKESMGKLLEGSRGILNGMSQLLLVLDQSEVRKIIKNCNGVREYIKVAEHVESLEEQATFAKNLSPGLTITTRQVQQRSEDLTNLSHAAILDEEMEQWNRSIPLLLSAMKSFAELRHSKPSSAVDAQENRNYILSVLDSSLVEVVRVLQLTSPSEEMGALAEATSSGAAGASFGGALPGTLAAKFFQARQLLAESENAKSPEVYKQRYEAVRALLDQTKDLAATLHPEDKEEVLRLVSELEALNEELKRLEESGEGNSERAQELRRLIAAKMNELEARMQRALARQVVETFRDPLGPLAALTEAASAAPDAPRREENYMLRKERFREHAFDMAETAVALAKSGAVTDKEHADQLVKTAKKVTALAPQVIHASKAMFDNHGNEAIKEHYQLMKEDYERQVQKLVKLVDGATDVVDFVRVSEEQLRADMQRAKEHIQSGSNPQGAFECVASAARTASRVVAVTQAEKENTEDQQYQEQLDRVAAAVGQAIPPMVTTAKTSITQPKNAEVYSQFCTKGDNLIEAVKEVGDAMERHRRPPTPPPERPPSPAAPPVPPPPEEEEEEEEPVPNPQENPIGFAAHKLIEDAKTWEERENAMVAAAKRMARLMMLMSKFARGEEGELHSKKDIIMTARQIVKESEEIVKMARIVANSCTDKRLKRSVLQVLDKIPTISTQLKIIATVKATRSASDPESDKEATEMLTDNAQNLMKAVSEVLYSTEAASIRVPPDSEAGRLGLRWIKRQR